MLTNVLLIILIVAIMVLYKSMRAHFLVLAEESDQKMKVLTDIRKAVENTEGLLAEFRRRF
jgi:uncharacterized membrane protein